ncbi:hydrolase [Campylobacterota bacterium]|nr:hydrolase [Campylobacterota bacterium]
MTQIVKPMGRQYQTNCYILTQNDKSIIIDPGMDADKWVLQNARNPIAILNTHGHFDHIWSNAKLQQELKILVIIRKEDESMLRSDPYSLGLTPSKADILVDNEDVITMGDFNFQFLHFPGHTQGCSMIKVDDRIFSGDFIFANTIGRSDFATSNPLDMLHSLERFMQVCEEDYPLFAGHGASTTVLRARKFVPSFIDMLRTDLML